MSLHESILMGLYLILITMILIKWTKSLTVVVLLELSSTMILVSFFLYVSFFNSVIVMMFMFFVGEALILLSSLYSTLRFSGLSYSSMLLL